MSGFAEKVYEVVRRIPKGKVLYYGAVARMINEPRKARFVGFALHQNPEPWKDGEGIPCHRVVFKDGSVLTGYVFGGPEVQKHLLESEGVLFLDDNHVDMNACLWDGSSSSDEDFEGPTAPPADFDWARELQD